MRGLGFDRKSFGGCLLLGRRGLDSRQGLLVRKFLGHDGSGIRVGSTCETEQISGECENTDRFFDREKYHRGYDRAGGRAPLPVWEGLNGIFK